MAVLCSAPVAAGSSAGRPRKYAAIQNVLCIEQNWHLLEIPEFGSYVGKASHAAVCFVKWVAHVVHTGNPTHTECEELLSHLPFLQFSKLTLLEMHLG